LRAGYEIESTDRTTGPLFAENGVTPSLDRASFPSELIEQIESDPHHDTLEFLIKARPLDDERKVRRIVDGIASAEARAERAELALHRLEKQTRGLADAAAAHAADGEALHAAREETRALREQARRSHVPRQTLDRLQLRTHDLATALFGSEDSRTREFERIESGDATTIASRLRERLDALRVGAFDVARNLAAAKAENVELQASSRRQVASLQRELAGVTCELLAAKRAFAAAESETPEPCAPCAAASAALGAWREAYAPLYAYVSQIAALELAAVKRERATNYEAIARIYRGARGRLKALAERLRLRPVR
jgi:hypothetical protein